MRIDGESGWVELLQRDDEEAFDVRCTVGEFAGRNPSIWIGANEVRRFLVELRALERDRRGEARLASMSPKEFELTVRVVDALGHAAVEGMVGRSQYTGHSYDRFAVTFSFSLDPTRLPRLVQDMTDLVSAA